MVGLFFVFFKQKTAYELRISDWVQTCAFRSSTAMVRWIVESGRSTRLSVLVGEHIAAADMVGRTHQPFLLHPLDHARGAVVADPQLPLQPACRGFLAFGGDLACLRIHAVLGARSEEHTSELQSLMRISYA